MEKPICFIALNAPIGDPAAKLVVNQEACRLLAELPAPVAVISVAGLYRTGKSFILNQLAGSRDGFDIGSSVEPQTQGIWCWIVPKEKLRQRGVREDMSVVLLDTEGLGSYTKTERHDTKILSLALLLSSYLVYNSLGTIDDTAVDKISLLVELTKNVKATSDSKEFQDPYEAAMFFPKFMWLLRDFSLDLTMEGRKVSPQQYLENALKPLDDSHPDAESKNRIRSCIRKFFPDRTCYTLKRPVVDEEQLQDLHKLPLEQFRPEYLEEVETLMTLIFQKSSPKTLFGSPLSGAMLVQLARRYVEGLESTGLPVLHNAWENVVEIQNRDAIKLAIETYRSQLEATLEGKIGDVASGKAIEQLELDIAHEEASVKALRVFCEKSVQQTASTTASEQTVRDSIGDLKKEIDVANLTKSRVQCTLLLDRELAALTSRVQSQQITSFDALLEAARHHHAKYLKDAIGPDKHAAYFRIDPSAWLDPPRLLSETLVVHAEGQLNTRAKEELDKAKHEYEVLQELYQSMDTVYKKEEESSKKLRAENTDLRYEGMAANRKLKENEKEISEQRDKIGELQSQCTKTESDLKESREALNTEKAAKEALEKSLAQEKRERVTEMACAGQEKIDLEARLKEAQSVPPLKEEQAGCKCVIM